jgi:hypothetical protein
MGPFIEARGGVRVIERLLSSLARWIREPYPDWAPRRGHVALVALCGRNGPLIEQMPEASN